MADKVRIRNGMTNATEGDVLGNASDNISTLGVVDLSSGHLEVTQDSPLGMSVQVAAGIVYVPNTSFDELDSDTPRFYPVVAEAETLEIAANTSGSTRIDIICEKIDKVIVPDADADNIATKIIVEGTPGGGVPTTPANCYKLAEVEVVNGETEITNAEITDTREQILFNQNFIDIASSIHSVSSKGTPADADEIGIVNSADSNSLWKLTWSNLKIAIKNYIASVSLTLTNKILSNPVIQDWNGWIDANETWSYSSPTEITVPSGAGSKYRIGMPFKLTANSVELQGYIVGVADTTLTVAGNALTDHTFSNNYFAMPGVVPQDFNEWFSWTPTYSALSSMTFTGVTTDFARFKMVGDTIYWQMRFNGTIGGTPSAYILVTIPVNTASDQALAFGYNNDGGNNSIIGYTLSSEDKFYIGKADESNYNTGVGKAFRMSGFYKATSS